MKYVTCVNFQIHIDCHHDNTSLSNHMPPHHSKLLQRKWPDKNNLPSNKPKCAFKKMIVFIFHSKYNTKQNVCSK